MSVKEAISIVGDNILLEPVKESKTESGIIIANEALHGSMKRSEGKILAIGEKVNKDRYKVGDRVLFGNNSESDFKRHGKEFYLIRVPAIVAKLSDEPVSDNDYVFKGDD